MVLLDLLLKVLLPICEVLERIFHAVFLVQTLDPPAILATDIASDRVENTLVPIHSRDLALLLQLEEEVNRVRLDLTKSHTGVHLQLTSSIEEM